MIRTTASVRETTHSDNNGRARTALDGVRLCVIAHIRGLGLRDLHVAILLRLRERKVLLVPLQAASRLSIARPTVQYGERDRGRTAQSRTRMGNLLLCAPGGARWCILEDALRFRVLAGHRRLVVRGLLRRLLRRHC